MFQNHEKMFQAKEKTSWSWKIVLLKNRNVQSAKENRLNNGKNIPTKSSERIFDTVMKFNCWTMQS